ncbi:MAG: hypothetical protein JXR95_11785 [Deltaproteobacteria bacterium]|nr:hypothetical protein [Deltaproteobacteria bacterium]
MFRAKSYFIVVAFFAVILTSGGCTLLSVSSMLKSDFGPAMMTGDIEEIRNNTTPSFGALFKNLSKSEIKFINNLGSKPGKSSSKKVKQKYDSFKLKGSRGVFTVKSGKSKILFHVQKIQGDWKVDDMVIFLGKMRISYRDIIGMYVSMKSVYGNIRNGKNDADHLGKKLFEAVELIVHDLSFLKNKISEGNSGKSSFSFKPDSFFVKTDKKSGTLSVKINNMLISAGFSRSYDDWKLLDVKLESSNSQPLILSELIPYFRYIPSFIGVYNSGHFDEKIAGTVIKRIWPSIGISGEKIIYAINYLKSFLPDSTSEIHIPKIKKYDYFDLTEGGIKWKIFPERLNIVASLRGVKFRVSLNKLGFIEKFSVIKGKNAVTSTDIESLIKVINVFSDLSLKNPQSRSYFLKQTVMLFTRRWSGKISGNLPEKISFPLDAMGSVLRNVIHQRLLAGRKTTTADNKTAGDKNFSSLMVSREGDRVVFSFLWQNSPVIIQFLKEDMIWKIDSVNINSTELMEMSILVPGLVRFAEGLYSMDANLLASSFDDLLGERLEKGLDVLFRVHGRKLKKLSQGIVTEFFRRLNTSGKEFSGKSGSKNDINIKSVMGNFDFRKTGNVYVLKISDQVLKFRMKKDKSVGLALSDEVYIALEKYNTSKSKKPFIMRNSIQFIEMIPLATGMYYSLLNGDIRSLGKFTDGNFRKKVLRGVTSAQLENLMKKLKIQLPVIKPEMIVDSFFGAASSDGSSGNKSTTSGVRLLGQIFRWRSRFPWAEIWLDKDGKRIDISFGWEYERKKPDSGRWVLSEIHVKVPILGKVKFTDYAKGIISGKIPLPF